MEFLVKRDVGVWKSAVLFDQIKELQNEKFHCNRTNR